MLLDSLIMLRLQVPLDSRKAGKHFETARAGVLNTLVHHFNMLQEMGMAVEGMGMLAWGIVAVKLLAWGIVAVKLGNRNRVIHLVAGVVLNGVRGLISCYWTV